MPKDRSRRWQLTENNADYTKEECANILASIGQTRYVIACCEMGERGTKHIHAFVIYGNAISLTTLKKHFARAHFEPCQGSNVQNRDYICKDDKEPFESGVMPIASESDSKVDVASEVVNLISNGQTLESIMMEYPALCDYVVRNYRSLKEIANDMPCNRRKHSR